MSDAELRRAYRSAVAGGEAASGPCPEPERLQALVEQTAPEDERLETLDHVMACPSCAEDLDLIRLIAGAPPRQAVRRPSRLAIAASVVLLGGLASSVWLLSRSGEAPVLRSSGGAVTLVSPVNGAPARGGQLMWRTVDGAVDYRVEVFDGSGRALFAGTTADTVLALPADFDPGSAAELSWWVRARLRDGSEVSSAAQRLGVTGR